MQTLSVTSVRRWLTLSTAMVVALGGLAELLRAYGIVSPRSALAAFLSLSFEQNLPTFYASLQLAMCAGLLAIIARSVHIDGGRYMWHWRVLATGFLVMALDEVAELHERTGQWLQLDGVLYFSWVVPAAVLVAVVGVAYVPFLRGLDRSTRRRFILAGAVYVTGALLMELPLGYWTERHGSANAGYALIDWVEETLELLGISLFLLALLKHLARGKFALALSCDGELAERERP